MVSQLWTALVGNSVMNLSAVPLFNTLASHTWPGIPDVRGGQLLSLLWQMERTQWLPTAEIERQQFQQLALVLRHALATVPFWRERGVPFALDDVSTLDLERWRQLPIVTREDIQIAGVSMHSSAPPSEHGGVTSQITSGSTGKPVQVLSTGLAELFWEAITLRDHFWHDRDLTAHLAAIRAVPSGRGVPPQGEQYAGWGKASNSLFQGGTSALLSIGATITEQVAWLTTQNPEYLITYPTNLAALLDKLSPASLPRLRQVRTFGEVVDTSLRQLCRAQLGVPLVDIYSCQEVGYIALQCPMLDGYHVQSESVLVEVIDERGNPCQPGEVGRVIVTSLHNWAMPLIRYELGDYAEVGTPCKCGRGLPVLRRIMGRRRNMFVLPNGQLRWPALELDNSHRPQQLPPVRQFQVIQRSLDEVEAVIAAYRPLTSDEEQQLTAWFYQSLGCDQFRVRFTYVDQIAPHPNGKYEDFRSDVAIPNASRDVTP